ncbi:hypothetical protein WA026_003097 [Henosepilachna vigintioctopunctata]|uniref:Uncharacterized protein n=1 Tax=Henosepilachna vigintioctopunctata TaxID=420089 RepID=A0AAW1TNM2_9CUCU
MNRQRDRRDTLVGRYEQTEQLRGTWEMAPNTTFHASERWNDDRSGQPLGGFAYRWDNQCQKYTNSLLLFEAFTLSSPIKGFQAEEYNEPSSTTNTIAVVTDDHNSGSNKLAPNNQNASVIGS